MNLLVPAALGLASLVAPLLVLYMLRSRRRRQEVPSTLLWASLHDPVTSAVPWKRLEVKPLLLLQLLVLALFVLSLARPFFTQPTLLGPHSVLVVDTSASMGLGGRLERAKQEVLELAGDVGPDKLVSVVEAGPVARVALAFGQTGEAVAEAVGSLTQSGGAADLSGAIRLARGLATPDRPAHLVLFTDGGGGPLPEEPVAGASHVPFDETADNLTISAFSVEESGGALRAFVAVANHTSVDRVVDLELAVDGIPAGTFELEAPAGGTATRVAPVEASAGDVVSVRRVGEPDGLALDDEAQLVLGTGPARGVALTGAGSPFLQALVTAAPGFRLDEAGGEIRIVDGGSVPEIDRPMWLLRTETPPPGLELTELAANLVATHQRPGEPLLDGVDLSSLAVAEAQVVEGLGWLPIVRAGDVPLVLLGEVDGHRVAYFTFDITHSNLPLQVGFPILGVRLLEWLEGGGAGDVSAAVAGEPIPLQPPAGSTVEVTLPDGTTRTLDSRSAAFTDTGLPGIYRVTYRLEDGGEQAGPVAVRRFDAEEAAATPRTVATTGLPTASPDEEALLIREWAPWVVGAVILLMLLEWWVGHQRPRPALLSAARVPR